MSSSRAGRRLSEERGLSENERECLAFILDTSMTGICTSSPPSPIISGAVFAKATLKFFFFFAFPLLLCCSEPYGNVVPSAAAALLTCWASGHLEVMATSILGADDHCRVPSAEYLSVEGLRKSTTSSLSLKFPLFLSLDISLPHFDLSLVFGVAGSSAIVTLPACEAMRARLWGKGPRRPGGSTADVMRVC